MTPNDRLIMQWICRVSDDKFNYRVRDSAFNCNYYFKVKENMFHAPRVTDREMFVRKPICRFFFPSLPLSLDCVFGQG